MKQRLAYTAEGDAQAVSTDPETIIRIIKDNAPARNESEKRALVGQLSEWLGLPHRDGDSFEVKMTGYKVLVSYVDLNRRQ